MSHPLGGGNYVVYACNYEEVIQDELRISLQRFAQRDGSGKNCCAT
jgi:hypothetical protein